MTGISTESATIGDASNTAIFRIHDITKVYHMGDVDVHALRGVNFDLNEGEFIVVLGPSGSGKSTLLNILGGLDTPTTGEVLYGGHNLTSAHPSDIGRRAVQRAIFDAWKAHPRRSTISSTIGLLGQSGRGTEGHRFRITGLLSWMLRIPGRILRTE